MTRRTFVIGDIHGDLASLFQLLSRLPTLGPSDTLVFLGDYVDRGPASAEVVAYLMRLPRETPAEVVFLLGNHEDAWLRVVDQGGWPEFVIPPKNGCLATMRSFVGGLPARDDEKPADHEFEALHLGTFLPPEVVAWLRTLKHFHEDDHAIYVHAGLPEEGGAFLHPSAVKKRAALLWCRDREFVENYRGKLVVFGHTLTRYLPPELSRYTPEDDTDAWAGPCVVGLDTGCGKGGFLSALELPSMRVYESR